MQRQLVRIIREIAQERGYGFQAYSGDWILRISKGERHTHVLGYNFELNPSASQMIAQDKSAAATLLAAAGVPCVEHHFLMRPSLSRYYFPERGNWHTMLQYFHDNGSRIVLKPADGTGGGGVHLATDTASLETAAHRLFEKHRGITLSPYLDIEKEHRVILLDDTVFTIYYKERPHVLGDGAATLGDLIRKKYNGDPRLSDYLTHMDGRLADTPPFGERVALNWRHNLGQGAVPVFETNVALRESLGMLAQHALGMLNLRFASVDIVTVEGRQLVLEINSGVMGESLSKHSPKGERIMRRAYGAALTAALGG